MSSKPTNKLSWKYSVREIKLLRELLDSEDEEVKGNNEISRAFFTE